MSRQQKKVAKYRRPISINIGMIVFFILFIYVIINIVIYFNKEHMSIYEVTQKSIADDNICKGIIIREEKLVTNNKAGYMNYYVKDGERVSKNSTIYTIDESGDIYEKLVKSEEDSELDSDGIAEIRKSIVNFKKSYSDTDYSAVYDFKYEIENEVLELNNYNLLTNLENIIGTDTSSKNFDIIKSDQSGIIVYSMDNMESITEDDITDETFNDENYSKILLRSKDLLPKGTPIYRIVTSEYWSVILSITEEQYQKLEEKDYVNITFIKNGLEATVPIKIFKKGNSYFAKLELDKYMIYYINERFIDIEITINSAEGLKIPKSSKVEKDFYKIPLEFFTKGSDSDSTGITRISYDEDSGEITFSFISTDIYYEDENYGYIDVSTIEKGDKICKEGNSEDQYQINDTGKLDGVYNVNKGYCVFRRIEIIYENEEYYIVNDNTPYGLSAYDNIVLNGNLAVDEKIIY